MTVERPERLAYSVEEAAQLLSLSERSVRELCTSGKLKARKYGSKWVIPRKSVLAWLDEADSTPPAGESNEPSKPSPHPLFKLVH